MVIVRLGRNNAHSLAARDVEGDIGKFAAGGEGTVRRAMGVGGEMGADGVIGGHFSGEKMKMRRSMDGMEGDILGGGEVDVDGEVGEIGILSSRDLEV